MPPGVPGQLKYLTMTDASKVWMPDTFFQNEKTGHFHNIIVPNVYIRIYPDGGVLYSIRSVVRVTSNGASPAQARHSPQTFIRPKFLSLPSRSCTSNRAGSGY